MLKGLIPTVAELVIKSGLVGKRPSNHNWQSSFRSLLKDLSDVFPGYPSKQFELLKVSSSLAFIIFHFSSLALIMDAVYILFCPSCSNKNLGSEDRFVTSLCTATFLVLKIESDTCSVLSEYLMTERTPYNVSSSLSCCCFFKKLYFMF